ncbi:Nif3-like dinuclear metal center hexameric protein [Marinobacter sp. ELB17]|uniref:Nif3-like dinuclear metal center hexameric protein n=1 Tax=Marinobacter sp. ELB17 TaxID=270374 RepID=UPI00055CCB83|nr:Nif3-like dinuclear metal center hexameric protein [Marinobacter sp. ELB17]
MAHRNEIMALLESWLTPEKFQDYSPNGLQVEGKAEIKTLITGVTASQALLDAAVELKADMVLVHHGYFWKGEDQRVVGIKRNRLKTLLTHEINLVGYHLPLDDHPLYGNNRNLARVLGIDSPEPLNGLVWRGEFAQALTPQALSERISGCLQRQPLHIEGGPDLIKTVAWCTGGAQGFIDTAADAGLDAYISGEISEPTTHTARERGIHYFAAGHHATERYGVQALGQALAQELGLAHRFIECDNPA